MVNDATGNPAYLTTNNTGQFIAVSTNVTGWVVSNNFVGDPEWIGILQRPLALHSADNRFTSRYTYVVIPASDTLDVNYIHNRAKQITTLGEGFLRNQGVGTWEINLAGFLADLNTNMWWLSYGVAAYNYSTGTPVTPSVGLAFNDANNLLSYRYGPPGSYTALASAAAGFPLSGFNLVGQNIDLYSRGPLMLGTSTNDTIPNLVALTAPWSGAENANHMFTHQDPFDPTKVPGFGANLIALGTSNDTYNSYTYYRMLAQLGSDSAPEQNKINVNWRNVVNGKVVPGMETNLIPWTPLDFFTNAAQAMFNQLQLRDFSNNLITITNIPIYETTFASGGTNINYYTPAVHRILQLAANMYDATTPRFVNSAPTNFPSVFRPVFQSLNGVASIVGYMEVSNDITATSFPFLEVTNFVLLNQPPNSIINMYGVPWVIGAKKGFPNFNEFSMQNPIQITRKLQFTNTTGRAQLPWTTNQLFDISITNSFGLEAWNSYTNAYSRPLRLVVSNELSIVVTNQLGTPFVNVLNLGFGVDTNLPFWSGWNQKLLDTNSFKVPLFVTTNFVNGTYLSHAPFLVPLAPPQWDAAVLPQIWLGLSFHVRYYLVDVNANRIIDFVNVSDNEPQINISGELQNGNDNRVDGPAVGDQWITNHVGGVVTAPLKGVLNQIDAGEGIFDPGNWLNDSKKSSEESQFRLNLNGNGGTNNFQDPYSPARTIYQLISWQANDPLVHYMRNDMTSTNGTQAQYNKVFESQTGVPFLPNLGSLNFSYQPWGGYHLPRGGTLNPNGKNGDFDNNYQIKDSLVGQSDDWDFPTNSLPGIGWLGRVHRGTPWQTVYMKPYNFNTNEWQNWINDNTIYTNVIGNTAVATLDWLNALPSQDYAIFDIFTATSSDNATRGQLDVNQDGLAAWSAVLSGVNVLTNTPTGLVPMTIGPAGVYSNNSSPVSAIVLGINNTRTNTSTNAPIFLNHVFQHSGDVLQTPQLTVASPFLTNELATITAGGVSDEVLERIPQQVMSLLTLNQSPRFVIYSYGQTLHPADHSLVIGGQFNALCTNYQVTAETVTRAVVRVDGSLDPRYTNDIVHPNGSYNPNPDPQGRFYPPHLVLEQFNVLSPD